MLRYNAIATIVWTLLLIPALLWWSESLLFVILMSVYANIAASLSAFLSARGEMKAKKRNNE